MEVKVILRGRDVYKCLLEGKKHVFKKGVPVVMHPSYAAIFGQKRDDNKKFLFEIIHGEPPKIVPQVRDTSEEAVDIAVKHRKYMKTRKTPGQSKKFVRKKMSARL